MNLFNKPIYSYTIPNSSIVTHKTHYNCCFISSFYIQIKKIYNDIPSFDIILNLLYPNMNNAYTHFADFPEKYHKLKNHLINTDPIWKSRFDNIVLQIMLPMKKNDESVVLSYIDLNINKSNITIDSLLDNVSDDKTIISIIQLHNHFEPVCVKNTNKLVQNIDDIILTM
jgi:hypothetical protein